VCACVRATCRSGSVFLQRRGVRQHCVHLQVASRSLLLSVDAWRRHRRCQSWLRRLASSSSAARLHQASLRPSPPPAAAAAGRHVLRRRSVQLRHQPHGFVQISDHENEFIVAVATFSAIPAPSTKVMIYLRIFPVYLPMTKLLASVMMMMTVII